MKIAEAEPRHAPEVAAIERECFRDPWPEDLIGRWITGEDKRFFVCTDDAGAVRGYIGAQFVLDEGYIGNVAVTHAARRQGVGRALVEAMTARACAEGLSFLTLEVRESNLPAQSLYLSLGYLPVGRRPRYYERPVEDAILMTKYFTGR